MTTRTVTGTIRQSDGTAWASQPVVFTLLTPFGAADGSYPPDETTATTNGSGVFSQALAVPDSDAARYQCLLPSGFSFTFALSAGVGSVTLESLLVQAITTATPNALQVLIDAHAAVVGSTTVSGHLKVDGTTITVTNGVASATGGGGAPTDATYVTLTTNGTLTGERVLTAGDNVTVTDNGAGSTVVVAVPTLPWADVTSTPTTLGGYGITDAASDAELTSEASARAAADTALDTRVDALELAPPTHATTHSSGGSDPISHNNLAGLTTGDPHTQYQTRVAPGRLVASATTHLSLPGVSLVSQGTATLVANTVRYFPIIVDTTSTANQLIIAVTVGGGTSTTARLGIYACDTDLVPGALIVDGGAVAVDGTGNKTASISTTLAPGRYLMALNTDGTPTVRIMRGGTRQGLLLATLGGNPIITQLSASQTYGAFPSTGTAITSVTSNTVPFEYAVFLQLSAV